MPLTCEQQEFWDEMDFGKPIRPEGSQTPEQAQSYVVKQIQYAYALEGIEAPDGATILAQYDADFAHG